MKLDYFINLIIKESTWKYYIWHIQIKVYIIECEGETLCKYLAELLSIIWMPPMP
jgi:hypothetical protein